MCEFPPSPPSSPIPRGLYRASADPHVYALRSRDACHSQTAAAYGEPAAPQGAAAVPALRPAPAPYVLLSECPPASPAARTCAPPYVCSPAACTCAPPYVSPRRCS